MFDYKNKTVFVAGGSSGINLGIALGFVRCGANVAICSRNEDKIASAVATLQEAIQDGNATKVVGFVADVRNYDSIETTLSAAHTQLGSIDVVISGAAGNFFANAADMSSNGFKTVIDIDLLGTFNVLRASYPFLRKPGASLINISADQAQRPLKMQVHACAAKAGVDQITRVLALEWAADGIRVNSVMPGPIEDTQGMALISQSPKIRDSFIARVPLARMGHKDDIANTCLFLSSPLASFITGVVLPVDGGLSIASGWNNNEY